jgi:hypothetical protein
MRTSKMTSLLDVLSATVLAVAVAGSVVPASAAIRMGGGGFHGGGFGGPHFGGGFDRGLRGSRKKMVRCVTLQIARQNTFHLSLKSHGDKLDPETRKRLRQTLERYAQR